jgi:hypothetical protein
MRLHRQLDPKCISQQTASGSFTLDPRDIVNQIGWAAQYECKQPVIDRASVMRAVESYFLSKS